MNKIITITFNRPRSFPEVAIHTSGAFYKRVDADVTEAQVREELARYVKPLPGTEIAINMHPKLPVTVVVSFDDAEVATEVVPQDPLSPSPV
jgi:hypothetical protein